MVTIPAPRLGVAVARWLEFATRERHRQARVGHGSALGVVPQLRGHRWPVVDIDTHGNIGLVVDGAVLIVFLERIAGLAERAHEVLLDGRQRSR